MVMIQTKLKILTISKFETEIHIYSCTKPNNVKIIMYAVKINNVLRMYYQNWIGLKYIN